MKSAHLLYFCPISQIIWQDVKNWLKTQNLNIELNIQNVILNNCKEKGIVDLIILIVKQYLYRSRCFKNKPNFQEIVKIISETKNIERYIAIQKNQLTCHNKKWSQLKM